MSILKKISSAVSNRTTYATGKLQAKAYSILITHTTSALAEFNLTPKEWAFLGLIYDRLKMQPKDVARELGVEAAYVTAMAAHLKEIRLLAEQKDTTDSRAKVVFLTNTGKAFVKKTEPILRARMKPLLRGIKLEDIMGYLTVLEQIIKNDSNTN